MTAPAALTSPAELALSPSVRSRRWVEEIAGWGIVLPLYFHGFIEDALEFGLGAGPIVSGLLLQLTLALASTRLVEVSFRRLPEGWMTTRAALPILLLAALLGGLPWAAVASAVAVASGLFPEHWRFTLPPVMWVHCFLLLLTWSGLHVFSRLSERSRRLRERALRIESLAHRSRASSLRAQLNPHFLFNALNSVVGLAERRPEQAQQMVLDVTQLLEQVLESSEDETTIRRELDFIAHYLRCESVRFGDRLEVGEHVDQVLLDELIPRLLLQPLVENAVKHGIRQPGRLLIEVRGKPREGQIEIEVRNTGRLVESRAQPAQGTTGAESGTGNGLRIVAQRLEASYPRSASFALVEEEGWVVARLSYDPREPYAAVSRW